MFEENITEYINKITGKIINIETFGNIIKLIKLERIKEEKRKDHFKILEETYKLYIKNHVELI
jgi:S-adenosylmethionine hydrolase